MNYFVYVFFISFVVDFHEKKINVLGEKDGNYFTKQQL